MDIYIFTNLNFLNHKLDSILLNAGYTSWNLVRRANSSNTSTCSSHATRSFSLTRSWSEIAYKKNMSTRLVNVNPELFTKIEITRNHKSNHKFFQSFIKSQFKTMNIAFPLPPKSVLVLEIFQWMSFFWPTSLKVALDVKIHQKTMHSSTV